jgi:hypothetical protein
MNLLPGLIGGAAAVYGVHAATGIDNANTTAVVFVAGFLVTEFMTRALLRGVKGSSAGFWQTTVGRWLIGRMAGGAVYTALTALLYKPAAYAVAYGVIGLVHLIGWQAVAAIAPELLWLIWGLAGVGAWFLRTPTKVVIGKVSSPLRRLYRLSRMGEGGSASFAGICEEWANLWRRGKTFFGHSLFDRHWPVGVKDDRMLLTLAGTGAGKDESAIINNVLLHDGSMFVVDVKGQVAAVTAEVLRRKGFEVHIIDQMNVLGRGTARIDPLHDLDPAALDYVEQVKKIVSAMSISSGSGRNRFFEEGGKRLCEGALDYLIRRKGEEFVPPQEQEEEPVDD